MNIRLLHPDEVLRRWDELRYLLAFAVEQGRGELAVDDIRKLVLNGRMFVLGGFDDEGALCLAVTAEVVVYPRKTVLLVGFGAGKAHDAHTGCMLAIRAAGLRVPEDISVIGFDDVQLSRYVGLTTVRQHLEQSGYLGMQTLLDLLSTPENVKPRHLPPLELVVRQTTQRLKAT